MDTAQEDVAPAATDAPEELGLMADLLESGALEQEQERRPAAAAKEVEQDSDGEEDLDVEAAPDAGAEADEEDRPATSPTTNRKVKVGDDEVDEADVLEWKKSGLRQQDYTRKTQAVAERQKKLDTEEASILADKQKYAGLIKEVEDLLKGAQAEPDWDKLRTTLTPAQFDEQWRTWQVHERRLQKVAEERQRADSEVAKAREKDASRRRETFQERLLEVLPEWKDEKVLQQDGAKILTYAESMGFTKEELRSVDRPELLKILRDAAQMAELRAELKARQANPKGKRAAERETLRPGARSAARPPRSRLESAAARLAKTGSDEDAKDFFEQLL